MKRRSIGRKLKRVVVLTLVFVLLLSVLMPAASAWREAPESNPFTEVDPDHWYHDYVSWAWINGVTTGTSPTEFEPDSNVTRGQFATFLWRIAGKPHVSPTHSFTDVPAGMFFTTPVAWAHASNIVEGLNPTTFAPNSPITREQLAAMLFRYIRYIDGDTSSSPGATDNFNDAGSISPWAIGYMNWAADQGILGIGTASLNPKGNALRSHTVATLSRVVSEFSIEAVNLPPLTEIPGALLQTGERVLQIEASAHSSFAILADGSLWAWGLNEGNILGDGTETNQNRPVKIMDDVIKISVGYWHGMAILSDNSLWGWGSISYGPDLYIAQPNSITPIKIMDDVVAVSAGLYHTMVIKADGSLWGWGLNSSGQLGDGTFTIRQDPVRIMDDVVAVSAGGEHTATIKTDGSLWAWGLNSHGQLGDGSTTNQNSPVQITQDVQSVFASYYHTLAIKADGTLWAWGFNGWGQLGDGTTTDRHAPVEIMNDVVAVSSDYHTAAILTDGSLWVWGNINNYNFLVDNSGVGWLRYGLFYIIDELITAQLQLRPMRFMDDVVAVSVDSLHSLVIKTDGSLWGWGLNIFGELGDGTNIDRSEPVNIYVGH